MANVKGFALRGLLRYIKEEGGGKSIPDILALLPEQDRAHFASTISASAWYPYSVFVHLIRAIDATIGKGDLTLCRRIGAVTANHDIHGIFKILAAISSFRSLVSRSGGFWSRYYDAGKYEVVEAGERNAIVRIHDFPEADSAHCILMEGWFEATAHLSGAKNMRVKHTECVRRGAAYCEFTATAS